MASKPKRPGSSGLRAGDHKRNLAMQIGLVAIVVLFAVGLIGYIVYSNTHGKIAADAGTPIQVSSSKLVTRDGTDEPKATLAVYEDFLCPACGNFERAFGPTIAKLIDSGAIEADYYTVAILDRPEYDNYSSRAGAAAHCVADENMEAFGRFHAMLYSERLQPAEGGGDYPDDNKLIEIARQAGVVGNVPSCINSGKYLKMVRGMAQTAGIHATPTLRINGEDYRPSTPEALVSKIRELVGDVPGMEAPAKQS